MADTLQEILSFNNDISTVQLCKNDKNTIIDYNTATGKPAGGETVDVPASVKLFFSGSTLKKKIESDRASGFNSVILSSDSSYVTVSPKAGAGEGLVLFYDSTSGSAEIGQYMVIKYRTSLSGERFEVYAGTEQFSPSGSSMLTIGTADRGYSNDGQWHILIVDLSLLAGYNAASDGKYYPKHIRFDILNTSHSSTSDSVDVAYFGVGTSIEDLLSIESDLSEAWVYDASGLRTVTIE